MSVCEFAWPIIKKDVSAVITVSDVTAMRLVCCGVLYYSNFND